MKSLLSPLFIVLLLVSMGTSLQAQTSQPKSTSKATAIEHVSIFKFNTQAKTYSPVPVTDHQCTIHVGERYVVKVGYYAHGKNKVFLTRSTMPEGIHLNNEYSITEEVENKSEDWPFFLVAGKPAQFELKFTLHNKDKKTLAVSAPLQINAIPESKGVYGVVHSKRTGLPVAGAKVNLPGRLSVTTDANGMYNIKKPKGSTLSLRVSKAKFSPYMAVNIPFKGGTRIDCYLEDAFPILTAAGIQYTTYDDRSTGSTYMHVAVLPRKGLEPGIKNAVKTGKGYPPYDSGMVFAAKEESLVTMNGGYFIYDADNSPLGYFYANGPQKYARWDSYDNLANGNFPVLGITLTRTGYRARIAMGHSELSEGIWGTTPKGDVIWDENKDGVSDVTYAYLSDPLILDKSGKPGFFAPSHKLNWARTVVGISKSGALIYLVADGEGIHGNQGATMGQLHGFFKDTLKASLALNFDGGGSTQFVVKTVSGMRNLATHTAEKPGYAIPGGVSQVKNYLFVKKK